MERILTKRKKYMERMDHALENDDILFEILIRLPPKYISKYKVVSRRWSHLINSSFFRYIYISRWQGDLHLLGFFAYGWRYMDRDADESTLPLTQLSSFFWPTCRSEGEGEVLDHKRDFLKGFLGHFISTRNGLVLTGFPLKKYYVCNPVTKQLYELPQPQLDCQDVSMAFWCDQESDGVSINFKVIIAKIDYIAFGKAYTVPIQIFSSRTKRWKQSTLRCSTTFDLEAWCVATVIRGAIVHWQTTNDRLAIHDLNQDDGHVTLIRGPRVRRARYWRRNTHKSFGESSDGYLQYAESDLEGISIWVLQKAQDSHISSNNADLHYTWNLRCKLSYSSMFKKNPAISSSYSDIERCRVSFLPQDSESIFIRVGFSMLLYHLDSGKVELIPIRRSDYFKDSYSGEYFDLVPYYEQVLTYLPF